MQKTNSTVIELWSTGLRIASRLFYYKFGRKEGGDIGEARVMQIKKKARRKEAENAK